VSATSITVGGGGQVVTAAVTRATTVTGKATSISGIKVGDVVSASISGANGKLTATSIQDPASLPSAPGQ
jgi:Cu/Ag efflux protein CusF